MDAGYCVGGQQVLQSEKMPYATLRWAKSSKAAKERRSCQEWLVSISAMCLAFTFFIRVLAYSPVSHLKTEAMIRSEGKQEKELKEAEETGDRDRKNE